jgi:hypothetical protein
MRTRPVKVARDTGHTAGLTQLVKATQCTSPMSQQKVKCRLSRIKRYRIAAYSNKNNTRENFIEI